MTYSFGGDVGINLKLYGLIKNQKVLIQYLRILYYICARMTQRKFLELFLHLKAYLKSYLEHSQSQTFSNLMANFEI